LLIGVISFARFVAKRTEFRFERCGFALGGV
jgi:hypothetical protein